MQEDNDFNADYYLEEHNRELQEEIDTLLKKSETQQLSVEDYYELYFNYNLLQNKSEYKEEINRYKNIVKDIMLNSPTQHSAEEYCCLSNIYFDEKMYDKCFEAINIAIDMEPDNAGYYFVKGRFYDQMGKHNFAKIEYSNAIRLDPEMESTIKLLRDSDNTINESKYLIFGLYLIAGIAGLYIVYSIIKIILLLIGAFSG